VGCCDRWRRAAAKVSPAPVRSSRTSVRSPAAPLPSTLHYLGHRPIEVRGSATGRTYRFDQGSRTRSVDPRDVAGLLRTKLFRRA
jgi:hypothetical protein